MRPARDAGGGGGGAEAGLLATAARRLERAELGLPLPAGVGTAAPGARAGSARLSAEPGTPGLPFGRPDASFPWAGPTAWPSPLLTPATPLSSPLLVLSLLSPPLRPLGRHSAPLSQPAGLTPGLPCRC